MGATRGRSKKRTILVEADPSDATAVYLGLNHSTGALGKLICWVQDPAKVMFRRIDEVPTHSRLGFILRDGSAVYYEALEGVGVRGPIPESSALDWATRDSDRWTRRYVLPINSTDAPRIMFNAQDTIRFWTYSGWQLVRMYANLRLGWPVLATAGKVVCSEACGRWTSGYFSLVGLDKTLDSTTPLDQLRLMKAHHLSPTTV